MGDAVGDVANATANATNATATAVSPEGQILAYSGLYLMALASIYFGSFRSLRFVQEHEREKKKIQNSITARDAKWFPLTASGALFGLYMLFKFDQVRLILDMVVEKLVPYLPQAVVAKLAGSNSDSAGGNLTSIKYSLGELFSNITGMQPPTLTKDHFAYFLLIFFCYEGVFALAHVVKPLVSFLIRSTVGTRLKFFTNRFYQLKFTSDAGQENGKKRHHRNSEAKHTKSESDDDDRHSDLIEWSWDRHDLFSLAICSVVGVAHILKPHWLCNNAFGLSFSLYGIEALHLSSFKGGMLLLAGLFVYDVFWVFATDVMATVATAIKAPILLMFPQDILVNGMAANKFAMLGLGDVVIPGIFLALLLRYGEHVKRRHYFYATLAAYGAGLLITIGVMHHFKAAQPALLYLVPTCIGAPSLLAAVSGEWSSLYNYSEDHLVEQDDSKKDKKKDSGKDKDSKKRK